MKEGKIPLFYCLKGVVKVEGLQDVRNDVQEIKQDIKDIRLEIKSLENRTTGNEKDIININKQLDKISANTTWILRLIVGGIIGAVLTLLLKGWHVMVSLAVMIGIVVGLSQIAKQLDYKQNMFRY